VFILCWNTLCFRTSRSCASSRFLLISSSSILFCASYSVAISNSFLLYSNYVVVSSSSLFFTSSSFLLFSTIVATLSFFCSYSSLSFNFFSSSILFFLSFYIDKALCSSSILPPCWEIPLLMKITSSYVFYIHWISSSS